MNVFNKFINRLVIVMFVLGIALSLSLLASVKVYADEEDAQSEPPPIIVRVSGFGAFEKKEHRNIESKRLKVMRASKLDAYRNLAERVYGISITGSSSVKDFMLKDDQFGSAVESVVRGARVVSITDHKDKGIETVLELLLPAYFQDCLNKVNAFKNSQNCFRTFPLVGGATPTTIPVPHKKSSPITHQQYYLR